MDFDGGTMSAEEFLRLFGDNFEFLTDIKPPSSSDEWCNQLPGYWVQANCKEVQANVSVSACVAAFHVQEDVGLDAESGRQFSGHISRGTAATYRRRNSDMSNKFGGAIISSFTGSQAIMPEKSGVSLTKNLPLRM